MTYGGLTCEFCNGQHPVMWLVTNLANGESLSFCAEDFPVALVPLLAGELGVDPGKMYDTVKRFVDREAAREAKEAGPAVPQDEPSQPGTDGSPSTPGDSPLDEPPISPGSLTSTRSDEHEPAS